VASVLAAGAVLLFGLGFNNKTSLSNHKEAREAHPVIAVQLENIAGNVAYIRDKVDDMDRRIGGGQ